MDAASELTLLVAFKLVVYSLGALVHLFLMVLILGQRRLRRLEWLLFLLIAALFMWNSGNLLALNVGLFYGVGPNSLVAISRLISFVGFLVAVPTVVFVHLEYLRQFRPDRLSHRILAAAFYLPVIVAPWWVGRLLGSLEFDPLLALRPYVAPLVVWLVLALAVGAALNWQVRRLAEERLAGFHTGLAVLLAFLALGLAGEYFFMNPALHGLGSYFATFLMLAGIAPGGLVGYSVFHYNFLGLQVRRNLIYTLVALFALLIYLNVIRRISGFLELRSILPSAVTEGVMIFLLVVFLEPVKKRINRLLQAAFVSEFERVQRLSAEIQECAQRTGDFQAVRNLVEDRLARELGLERVRLAVGQDQVSPPDSALPRKVRFFPIGRGDVLLGTLIVTPVTADLSGDLYAALQLLADQLAAALELCQLIADKVRLERALAERAKMAFLGEMAARIAHNVKNPLSSMKTLVQLMEENEDLPELARRDARLVIAEIDRLNNNISQILRYAKPARDTDRPADLGGVVSRVVNLSRADAERRQVRLEWEAVPERIAVEGGEEAAADIVSNLLVNALEASPPGSVVRVQLEREPAAGQVVLTVEDEGPGVPAEIREKIFQPFFTTRPGGTGLGLAIVTRRAEEIGGEVDFVSPWKSGSRGGTCFRVRFRAAS